MTAASIQSLAAEAASWFETAQRSDDEESCYVRLRDGKPEWIQNLVYAAHGDMFPDDWRYDAIRAACGHLAELEDADDDSHEFADAHVDVYTGRLTAWLASNLTRVGYCDEAREEFGSDDRTGITGLIALGQYAEASEVYNHARCCLRERWLEVAPADAVEALDA